MNTTQCTIGQRLAFDDGKKPGFCVVLEVMPRALVVQFDDRYAPTTIMHTDKTWVDYLEGSE